MSETSTTTSQGPSLLGRPRLDWALGLILLGVSVGVCALYAERTQRRLQSGKQRVDFEVFQVNAEVAARGGNVYRTHLRRPLYPYIYPPFLVSVLRPLAGRSHPAAVLLWNVLQLLLIPLGFELLRRLLGALEMVHPPLLAGAAVLLCTWFLADNITWAQVNLLVWLCILGALLLLVRERPLLSGAVLGLATSIKIMPVVVLLLLPTLPWRRIALWLGGVALGLVVCCLLLPGLINGFGWAWDANVAFVELMHRTVLGGIRTLPWGNNCANHSLMFTLEHWAGMCVPRSHRISPEAIAGINLALRVLIGVATLATAILLKWRRDRAAWGLAVSQLVLVMLLANPITWIHHWVLLTLPLALLAGTVFAPELSQFQRWFAAALAAFFAAATVTAPQLETFKPGTLSAAHLLLWAATTTLLLTLQISSLCGQRVCPPERPLEPQ